MSDFEAVVERIRTGRRFLVASHERPDGDAIGSIHAVAFALRALGKEASVVIDAEPPAFLRPFPGVAEARVTTAVDEVADAALVIDCSSPDRIGTAGLDRSPVLNIDHHPGNTRFGAVNWIDESAAACGEMAYTLIEALGVPMTREIATHIYLAVLTDTGSFRFSHVTPRTFEIARRTVEAGADPQWIARTHYDGSTLARVRIFGAVLSDMTVDPSGRVALLAITREMAAALGGSYDDTEGLINFPLTVKDVQAVAFLKEQAPGSWRVSLRSKGAVDVGVIARRYGGGGHANAAGCPAAGDRTTVQAVFATALEAAVEAPWQGV